MTCERFSARLTTTFTPDEDGDWTFGLVAAGRARLLVDGELVIDNWTEFEPSPVFFGMGSKEKTGTVAMKAGEARQLVVEYRAATTFAAGVHVGAIRPIGADRIAEAVAAREGRGRRRRRSSASTRSRRPKDTTASRWTSPATRTS